MTTTLFLRVYFQYSSKVLYRPSWTKRNTKRSNERTRRWVQSIIGFRRVERNDASGQHSQSRSTVTQWALSLCWMRCDHTGDRPARARLQVVAQYQLKDIPTPTARAVLRLLSRLVGSVYIVAPSGEWDYNLLLVTRPLSIPLNFWTWNQLTRGLP